MSGLDDWMDAHPDVRIACLPNAGGRRAIEFGVRAREPAAYAALQALESQLVDAGMPLGARSRVKSSSQEPD